MPGICKVTFGISSGHGIISTDKKTYLWSSEQGLKDAAGWHAGMWLQMEGRAEFEMEDEYPFFKITAHIRQEVTLNRLLDNVPVIIDPRVEPALRNRFALLMEPRLADDALLEKVRSVVLMAPPPHGCDITIAPTEGKVGALYAAIREKFGEETSEPLPNPNEEVLAIASCSYELTAGTIESIRYQMEGGAHHRGILGDPKKKH